LIVVFNKKKERIYILKRLIDTSQEGN